MTTTATSDDLREHRLRILEEHFRSEVDQNLDVTLATFNGHLRYEIMATGRILDGESLRR